MSDLKANPTKSARNMTLYDASLGFECLQVEAEELCSLLHLCAGNGEVPDRVKYALNACAGLADALAAKALEFSDQAIAASSVDRGRNGAEFPIAAHLRGDRPSMDMEHLD